MSTTPVEVRLGYVVKQVQHALRANMDRQLKSIGLTAAQYALMTAIEHEPGASGASLAKRCFITPQSVNGLISLLENSRFISRSPSPTHGRIIETKLTPMGQERLTQAHTLVERIEARMLAGLQTDDIERFDVLLRQCLRNLDEMGDAG